MSPNDTNDTDEPALNNLEQRKDQLEELGWNTETVDEELSAKERRRQRLLERDRLTDVLENRDLPSHVRDECETAIDEIDEALAQDRRDQAEALRKRADRAEQVADHHAEAWDQDSLSGHETAEELRKRANDIDPDTDTDALGGSSTGTTTSVLSEEVHVKSAVDDILEYLDGPNTPEIESIDEAIQYLEERAEHHENDGIGRGFAEKMRTRAKVLKAYQADEFTIEFDHNPGWITDEVRA